MASGFLTTAEKATEYGSGSNEAEGSNPAQVEGLSKLPFLRHVDRRVVEVTDDGVGNPADWNEPDGTREDEEEPSHQNNIALGLPAALRAPCALHPNNGNHESEEREHRPSAHQPSGCLQVRREGQHGVIDLTLHPDVGLPDAVHPQAFPNGLKHDDVVLDEGRHSPLGHARDSERPDHANATNEQPGNLQSTTNHVAFGRRAHLSRFPESDARCWQKNEQLFPKVFVPCAKKVSESVSTTLNQLKSGTGYLGLGCTFIAFVIPLPPLTQRGRLSNQVEQLSKAREKTGCV